MSRAVVKQCAVVPDGKLIGSYDDNPWNNFIVYEVEFEDSNFKEYGANVIADNIICQVYHDGYSLTLMDGIVDCEKDHNIAVYKQGKYLITCRGHK